MSVQSIGLTLKQESLFSLGRCCHIIELSWKYDQLVFFRHFQIFDKLKNKQAILRNVNTFNASLVIL